MRLINRLGSFTLPLKQLGVLTLLLATSAFSLGQSFPLTIEHKFGTTTIPERPERVASIDYGGLGNLLAVGVQPVTVMQWREMDGFDYTAGPWAEPYLTTEPVVLSSTVDLEAIAGENPDVIVAVYSGIDQDAYDRLSLIAPVVAVPAGVGDYALTWEERARLAARAVGEEAEAERQIAAIRQQVDEAASANPEWSEMTAVLGGFRDGNPWAYTPSDGRMELVSSMGFISLPAVVEHAEGFNIELSPEHIDILDSDVLIHYGTTDATLEALDNPARDFLSAPRNGREIFLPDDVVAALARMSLLSIPPALDAMIPMLEAATDGDPDTPIPDARR